MGAVESAFFRGHGGDGGQLVGIAVRAGRVGQTGGESERPVPHALAGEIAHGVQFGVGGQARRPTHGGDADGRMGYEVEHIAGGVAVEESEEVGDAAPTYVRRSAVDRRQVNEELLQGAGSGGRIGKAVHAQGLGSHTLADFGLVVWIGEQLQVGMGMHVDEAGADDVATGVDGAAGIHGRRVAADDMNGVAGDGNAGAVTGGSGAVDHRAVGK